MKKLLLLLLCAFVLVPINFLRAQEAAEKSTFPGVKKAMSAEDYETAGLMKLSNEERAELDKFLRGFLSSSNEPAAKKATTRPVEEAVKEEDATPLPVEETVKGQKTTAAEVIQSRLVGPFTGYDGHSTFTLENGQVWTQSQPDSAVFKKVDSPPVLILKDNVGYRMYIAGGSDIRVQRVK
jgi:uncharacterized protein YdaU (DUF1376 family)